MKLTQVSTKPSRRAQRYLVRVGVEEFTVFVHRGSVPREKLGELIAHHEKDSADITLLQNTL